MSLSDDIIAGCADDATPLATILRKCLIFASQLRSNELRSWALRELEGYKAEDELPDYRILKIISKGLFLGGFGSQLNDQPLPSAVLKEEHRHWATTAEVRQGVAAVEALATKDKSGRAQRPWPADMVVFYQEKFFQGFALNRAWQEIPMSAMVEILDTVRTRVLKFVIELQDELGDIGSIVASRKVDRVAPVVHNVFQTTVYGGTAIVASETGEIDARTQTIVTQGDRDTLINALRARGIDNAEIGELESAIEADSSSHEIVQKPNVLAWIQKAAKKIGGAASGVAVDVAKASLTSLLSSYLGLPSQ